MEYCIITCQSKNDESQLQNICVGDRNHLAEHCVDHCYSGRTDDSHIYIQADNDTEAGPC